MTFIGLSKPKEQNVSKALETGDIASQLDNFKSSKGFRLITFLRHPGCPFAEASVKDLKQVYEKYPDVEFFIVTHGDESVCQTWFGKIGGTQGLQIVHDEE